MKSSSLALQTIPTLKIDNAYKNPYDVAFEDLHRAAYRNGPLARSVYAPKDAIGKITYKVLEEFAVSTRDMEDVVKMVLHYVYRFFRPSTLQLSRQYYSA